MSIDKLDLEADFAAYQKQLEADYNFAPDVGDRSRWLVTPEMVALARQVIRSQVKRRPKRKKPNGGRP